jgi:hypothetical protein
VTRFFFFFYWLLLLIDIYYYYLYVSSLRGTGFKSWAWPFLFMKISCLVVSEILDRGLGCEKTLTYVIHLSRSNSISWSYILGVECIIYYCEWLKNSADGNAVVICAWCKWTSTREIVLGLVGWGVWDRWRRHLVTGEGTLRYDLDTGPSSPLWWWDTLWAAHASPKVVVPVVTRPHKPVDICTGFYFFFFSLPHCMSPRHLVCQLCTQAILERCLFLNTK